MIITTAGYIALDYLVKAGEAKEELDNARALCKAWCDFWSKKVKEDG